MTLTLLALVACTSTTAIRPADLAHLDGYDARHPPAQATPPPRLEALDGPPVALQPSSKLLLYVGGTCLGGQFDSIRVRDGVFEGHISDGASITARMDEIRAAEVETPSSSSKLPLAAMLGAVGVAMVLGVTLLLVQNTTTTVEGRPLRVRGRTIAAPVAPSEAWRGDGPAPDTTALSFTARAALAAAWRETARTEHASIAAFSRLSLTLMGFGAPARLVEGTHRAALEEVRHARLAFTLASGYAETALAPGPLVELRAAPATTATSLIELAHESLLDGCLNEGTAAAVAAEAARRARDPAVREALAVIARDESSHTELSWEIVAWCCARIGASLTGDLRAALARAPLPAAPIEISPRLETELADHGCLASESWLRHAERIRRAADQRLILLTTAANTVFAEAS